jgi:glycine/D-amino acid oxidase-like deaminating enzyme
VISLETLDTADVVVVGAGIAGVCTAFELNRRGFDVVVCDQRFPAFGASGRNPGSLWLQPRRAGVELELARAGKLKYDEYLGVLGDVFDYRTSGGLFFYETEEQGRILEDYATDRRAAGLNVEIVTREQALKHAPLLPSTALGAVFCADDAQIDAQLFVRELTTTSVRAGVRMFDKTSVLSLLRHGDAVTGVRTIRGDIHAGGVVWATGAWAKNLVAEGITIPIRTARMGQMVTQPVGQRPGAIMHGPRGVSACGALRDLQSFDAAAFAPPAPVPVHDGDFVAVGDGVVSEGWDYDDSITVSPGGSLYIGNSVDGPGALNPHTGIAATHALVSTALQRYGRYAHFGVTGLWAGLMSDTPDHLPLVDRVDGVYVNVGHLWGIASGPVCWQVLADMIAGDPNAFSTALRADRPALVYAGTADS